MEIDGAALLRAIDIANLLRDVGNHDRVEDLVPGNPGSPKSCVLANTFNCNCIVRNGLAIHDPAYDINERGDWYAYFQDKVYADALAKELGETVFSGKFAHSGFAGAKKNAADAWAVELPREVGQIAELFDQGDLDNKYYLGRQEEE